jgi:hypothetical protein
MKDRPALVHLIWVEYAVKIDEEDGTGIECANRMPRA